MRWFKHMTNSSLDEKLARFMDKYGLEAYGFFWRVLEAIAENVDETDRKHVEYSSKTWCKLLGIRPQTFRKLISESEVSGLFQVCFNSDLIRVESPNILKFRDEWTRKKSKTPEQRIEEEKEEETEEDKDKKTLPDDGVAVPVPDASPPPDAVYLLPLKSRAGTKERAFPVTKELFDVWRDAYPLVDVKHELREVKSWLVSNPKKRPASDMARFVNSWLDRTQNDLARKEARASPAPQLKTFQEIAADNVWSSAERQISQEAGHGL